jgi:hypothetical protein
MSDAATVEQLFDKSALADSPFATGFSRWEKEIAILVAGFSRLANLASAVVCLAKAQPSSRLKPAHKHNQHGLPPAKTGGK